MTYACLNSIKSMYARVMGFLGFVGNFVNKIDLLILFTSYKMLIFVYV